MPTIAFVKKGAFSHTNDSVRRLLAAAFPGHAIHVVDVEHELSGRWAVFARNLLDVGTLYGPRILARRLSIGDCVLRTPYAFDAVRRSILDATREIAADCTFTFQTQSLFDAHLPGVPHFVYTDHTHLTNLYYPGFDRSRLFASSWIAREREIYHHATRTFTMSEHVRRSVVEHYGVEADRVACIGAGSNAPERLAGGARRDCPPNILFVGTDWSRKGGPDLVDAFRLVLAQRPDATLTIVGCAPELHVTNCTIVGRVALERVADYYAAATVFCLPTRVEPFGIAFLEAQAHGLPVVATDIGAVPDLVENGRTGRLVATGDVGGLASALLHFLNDAGARERAREAGPRRVRERYTWEAVGERLTREIASALAAVTG